MYRHFMKLHNYFTVKHRYNITVYIFVQCELDMFVVGWNECGYHNGRCTHLCVAHSNSSGLSIFHHCACPTHYVLAADNQTCLRKSTT